MGNSFFYILSALAQSFTAIITFIFFGFPLFGQGFDPNAISIRPWIEATICIGQPDSFTINDTLRKFFRPLGAEILCQSKNDKIYLITAKHMFLDSTQQW